MGIRARAQRLGGLWRRWPAWRRSRLLSVLCVAAAVVVAGGGVAWWLSRDAAESTATMTATVTSETVRKTVAASGTVQPARSADLDFSVSGTVTEVLVEEGDRVRVGQALATVDDTALVAARTAAASSLDAALTQLDEDTDAGADDVALAADETAVVAARASLVEARQAVAEATLRATVRGTVTAVSVSVGDVVGSGGSTASGGSGASATSSTSSTSSTTTATAAVGVVSTRRFLVDATVASDDVESLKEGLQAEISVTGLDDKVYGTVQSIGLVAETSSAGAAVFPVTIEVTGARDDLYPGSSAEATIVVSQTEGVLTVSTRALQTDDNGTTYVDKVVDGGTVRTEVETGQTYGMTTEVVSGLAEGDQVEVAGFSAPAGSGSDSDDSEDSGFPDGGFPGGQMPRGEIPAMPGAAQ